MGTVPIAATHGAGGSVVAPAVAERLRLPLVDRAIPIALAHELAGPLHDALADDELHQPRLVGRAPRSVLDMSGLYVGVPVPPPHLGADDPGAPTEGAPPRGAARGGA